MGNAPALATVGQAVDRAYADALRRWLEQHAGGLPWEVAARERIKSYSLRCELLAGRPSRVYVDVVAARRWQSETYGYTIRLVGHRHTTVALEREL